METKNYIWIVIFLLIGIVLFYKFSGFFSILGSTYPYSQQTTFSGNNVIYYSASPFGIYIPSNCQPGGTGTVYCQQTLTVYDNSIHTMLKAELFDVGSRSGSTSITKIDKKFVLQDIDKITLNIASSGGFTHVRGVGSIGDCQAITDNAKVYLSDLTSDYLIYQFDYPTWATGSENIDGKLIIYRNPTSGDYLRDFNSQVAPIELDKSKEYYITIVSEVYVQCSPGGGDYITQDFQVSEISFEYLNAQQNQSNESSNASEPIETPAPSGGGGGGGGGGSYIPSETETNETICGDGICSEGEDSANCLSDCPKPKSNLTQYAIVIVIIIAIIGYIIYSRRKK